MKKLKQLTALGIAGIAIILTSIIYALCYVVDQLTVIEERLDPS